MEMASIPSVSTIRRASVFYLKNGNTGGYADMSGSLFLVRAPDEAAALSILKADVYTRSGVWTGFRARALGRVVRREELETD